jgi:hypothetical protein
MILDVWCTNYIVFFNLLEHFTNAPVWIMKIAFNLISVRLHFLRHFYVIDYLTNIHMKKWNKLVARKLEEEEKNEPFFWRKFPQLWLTIKNSQQDIKFFHLRRCNITFIKLLQIEFCESETFISATFFRIGQIVRAFILLCWICL